ncbi:hypothetical protein N7474_002885 [Penicillium riverlandense]|uniref:uncharacterized protein n=1 Tax=Penicillium riverlandense TaxID=1903569 RepID=UPI002548902B|nr:uncharacterized protein N7474_002885 [Penicillium riverlandense]KAJ5825747.1 hypothetical protein N7474_002885 [Penicillium riverlandense]
MAFSFGFSGDDIDIDESEGNNELPDVSSLQEKDSSLPELVKASQHDMNDWLSTLPSQISYNTLVIKGDRQIARREIFDIRTQLMAEDSAGYDNEALIAGLEKGDIKPQFYEGGFKTWECALDLARLVTGETGEENDAGQAEDTHYIELGAGTAVPSLALFASLLSHTSGSEQRRKTHFTLADYNASVLRLVTLPNLLLTWHNSRAQPGLESQPQQTQEELELDITPELITEFKNDLNQRRITVSFISGAWSPEFVDLVSSAENLNSDQKRHSLILASETIYSPSSLGAFSETLLDLLRRASTASTSTAQTRALVAAKKVYFGVGGGVDEFLAVLANICSDGLDVQQKLDIQSEGVGRVVLEIGLANH